MLGALRRQSQSIFIKMLLGLLILSFAVWGVGDMVTSAVSENAAVTVGEKEISPYRLQREYRVELNRLRRFGMQIDSEQAREIGLMVSLARRMADRLVLTTASETLGLTVSDDAVRRWIANAPEFKGPTGQFDRGRFYQVISANGLSEAGFAEVIKEDLGRRALAQVVTDGAVAPSILVRELLAYQLEARRIELGTLPLDEATEIPSPDDETLAKFHEEKANAYMKPERRKLTALIVTLDSIADSIDVPEEKLAAVYEERKESYITEATVNMQQMLFPDEAKAQEARKRIVAGETFAAVAKDMLQLEESDIDLGKLTAAEVQPPELSEAVFSLPVDGISEPVKSILGWHLVKVTAKTTRVEKTLDDVRQELSREVAREMGLDTLYEMINDVENTLAESGNRLEDAAKLIGREVTVIEAIDPRGNDASGQPVPDLPQPAQFVATAFQTDPGLTSKVVDSEEALFVLRVEKVSPSEITPLAEIKEEVENDWKTEQRMEAIGKKAEDLVKRASEGGAFSQLMTQADGKTETPPNLLRNGSYGAEKGPTLPSELVDQIFDAKVGEVVMTKTDDGYQIAHLLEVVPAETPDQAMVDRETEGLSNAIGGDVVEELVSVLRNQIGVEINQGVINELY